MVAKIQIIKNCVLYVLLIFPMFLQAQSIQRIEPGNWWVGMKLNKVTLLVYGRDIQHLQPEIKYTGVNIVETEKVENPNYLFVTLVIDSGAAAGNAKIHFKKGNKIVISKDFLCWPVKKIVPPGLVFQRRMPYCG